MIDEAKREESYDAVCDGTKISISRKCILTRSGFYVGVCKYKLVSSVVCCYNM